MITLIVGDARYLPLANQSVQCVVTSPPYWGLRDYKTAPQQWSDGTCSALGLEPTPHMYVAHLVEIFREVRRVLADDGTVWIVIGDSYQNAKGQAHGVDPKQAARRHLRTAHPNDLRIPGLKPKDLVGIPWLVAFALRDDGWYLRSDVIWAKAHEFCPGGVGSTMPLGGKKADRPTPAHEYVFLLSKSRTYYFDEEAIKQNGVYPSGTRAAKGSGTRQGNRRGTHKNDRLTDATGAASRSRSSAFHDRWDNDYAIYSGKRRLRDVWFISPQPYKEAHFATFPPRLVEPCILAGSRAGNDEYLPDPVLDPFCGSGTVGLVCQRLGRDFIGVDLQPAYIDLARRRLLSDREKIFGSMNDMTVVAPL